MQLGLMMCFFSVVAGTMTGFYLYKKESTREKYFDTLVSFCNHLITDIRFSQRSLSELIRSFMADRPSPLSPNLNEYLAYVNGGEGGLSLSKGTLKPSEHMDIKSFFGTLGTLDSQTQVYEIEGYKQRFILCKEAQAKRNEKYAKNYIKLGFLFGLALGVILL